MRRLASSIDDAVFDELTDVIHVLSSYQVFDQMATPQRGEGAGAALIEDLVWVVLRR